MGRAWTCYSRARLHNPSFLTLALVMGRTNMRKVISVPSTACSIPPPLVTSRAPKHSKKNERENKQQTPSGRMPDHMLPRPLGLTLKVLCLADFLAHRLPLLLPLVTPNLWHHGPSPEFSVPRFWCAIPSLWCLPSYLTCFPFHFLILKIHHENKML